MQNIEFNVEGHMLWIGVDLSKDGLASKSGKSNVIASTQGNTNFVADGRVYKVGVNVFTPAS